MFVRSRDLVFWSDISDPVWVWTLQLGGAEGDFLSSSVCPRLGQCGHRRSVSLHSGDRGGMDSAPRGLHMASQEVGSDDRSFCILYESLLWSLFCTGVGSLGCGFGCHAPVMGFASGICFSSVCYDSSGSGEAEVVAGRNSHFDCAILAAEGVISRSSRISSGAPSASSRQVGSDVPVACSEVPPKPPMLWLHAWRLSSGSPEPAASLQKWLEDMAARIFGSQLPGEVVCVSSLMCGHKSLCF